MKKEAAQPEKHRTALFFNENIFLFFGIGEQRRAAARHKKDEKNSSAGAKMLVYYIIRDLMLVWRGKEQTDGLWRISRQ